MGGGKTFSIDDMMRILDDPATKYTTTPEHALKSAQFMNDIGSLKHRPASIRDLIFAYGPIAAGTYGTPAWPRRRGPVEAQVERRSALAGAPAGRIADSGPGPFPPSS